MRLHASDPPGGTRMVEVHSSTIEGPIDPLIDGERLSVVDARRNGTPGFTEVHGTLGSRVRRRGDRPCRPARTLPGDEAAASNRDQLDERIGVAVAVELAVAGDECRSKGVRIAGTPRLIHLHRDRVLLPFESEVGAALEVGSHRA